MFISQMAIRLFISVCVRHVKSQYRAHTIHFHMNTGVDVQRHLLNLHLARPELAKCHGLLQHTLLLLGCVLNSIGHW